MREFGTLDLPVRISDTDFKAHPEVYAGLVLRGNAWTRGHMYGKTFADKIQANIERCLARDDIPPW